MRSLTGIKPTAMPHVGNLLGAIEPALRLQRENEAFYFIADLHALTTLHDAGQMRRYSREVAATWLAFGLDPARTTLWVQSDVPEVCELAWALGCVTGLGLLERAHAYKAARDRGEELGAGTFFYPVLMAADILAYDTDFVPVGKDQVQHVEMTRDMAAAFNTRFGEVLKLPQARVQEDVATVVGLDGRKMSKSYGNGIEVFLPPKQLRKKVMSIVTDSKGVEDVKDPDADNVFALYRLFASPEQVADLARRYRAGGLGYGHAKQELYDVMEARLGPARARFEEWMADPARLDGVLEDGASRARRVAAGVLERVRGAIGVTRRPRGFTN
ncbi:MAG: tryptophan--tRNA ligase [Myxococcota bacterium]